MAHRNRLAAEQVVAAMDFLRQASVLLNRAEGLARGNEARDGTAALHDAVAELRDQCRDLLFAIDFEPVAS